MSLKLKIKKGDKVVVLSGEDKGKTGEVVKAMPKEGKVVVQGINLVKKTYQTQPDHPGRHRYQRSSDPCFQCRHCCQ